MSDDQENLRLHIPGPLGHYFVITKLNKGGMADVFLAMHAGDPSRWVALKLLRPRLDGQKRFIEMFVSEGRLGLMLNHPNIAQTLEVGHADRTDGPMHYLAMEYVHGRDLGAVSRYFRKGGTRLPVGQSLYMMEEVLKGLGYAHELTDETGMPLHLVNRDVSPANVMVGFDGAVKLIDFGIAQATLDYRSQIGSIKGKIRYMSPEQVRGLPVDARSDIFSLSVVFYQLITGVDPFPGEGDFDRMERIRSGDIRPPSEINRHVTPELELIVLKGLAKDPVARYQTAEEMLEDLAVVRAREPRPYGSAELAEFMHRVFRDDLELLASKVSKAETIVRSALGQLIPIWVAQAGPQQVPSSEAVAGVIQSELIRQMIALAPEPAPGEKLEPAVLDPSAVSIDLSMSIDVSMGGEGAVEHSPGPQAAAYATPVPTASAPSAPGWTRWALIGLAAAILVLMVVLAVKIVL